MSTVGSRFVLLLTTTIDPGGTLMVARNDPLTRLQDYKTALSAWLTCDAVRHIVLYENSGYDISSLRNLAFAFPDHEVEIHSFEGNKEGATRGKGYAELAGIARVLQESKLIRADDFIVKCTGRLVVRNATQLLRAISGEHFDIMCTLHSYLTYAESRLFVATRDFLSSYLLPQQQSIDDSRGFMFENGLACAAARAVADRKAWRPFPIFPIIEGISGTTGERLTDPPARRLLRTLSHRFRRFGYRT